MYVCRVHPDTPVYELRQELETQISCNLLPTEYVFLRCVGRCFTVVRCFTVDRCNHVDISSVALRHWFAVDMEMWRRPEERRSWVSKIGCVHPPSLHPYLPLLPSFPFPGASHWGQPEGLRSAEFGRQKVSVHFEVKNRPHCRLISTKVSKSFTNDYMRIH